MFKPITKYLLISIIIVNVTGIALAQPKDNSPFSQFGLGDFVDSDMPSSHAMGGLGAIYHDFFEANLENPASLGFLQYTSLQLGFMVKRSNYTRIDEKQTIWNGNTNHFSLNIPLINPLNEALERRESKFSWATSFSLRPFSQVGYNVSIVDEVDSIGTVQSNFRGYGGLYNITWGNGFKYKNLSAGINLNILRGQQVYESQTYFADLSNAFNDAFNSTISYKGFNYRIGAIYELPLDLKAARGEDDKPSKLLSAGFFVNGKTNFNTKSDISRLSINSLTSDVDTAVYVTDASGKGIIPGPWGFGVMYRHAGDFRVGVDYQASKWSIYENEARPATMKDASKFSFGGAWIPDANSITSYFKRVEYRAGFYTKNDPRVIEDSQVKEAAFTFGAAFPFIIQRNISWMQLGFDIGKRTGGDRLTDNFVRANIAFIFNDNAWFIKGKYD
ncbi:MAG: hypothetical protein IPL92_03435 [Saprospiraceae bacterium]|nr:hypothetical protein [Candidatus Opimibacter iunctus]